MPEREERLRGILEEMTVCASNTDYESAHSYADDLLVEVLEIVSPGTPCADLVSEIVSQWHEVGNWYA